jgi:UDP-galactopyranose mutase
MKPITTNRPDLFVFSHLRWNFVYQRPQHLMSRFALMQRVYFFEEPLYEDSCKEAHLRFSHEGPGLSIVTPVLPKALQDTMSVPKTLAFLLDSIRAHFEVKEYVLWYYTPLALRFTQHWIKSAQAVVYDCMDELSLFKGADPSLLHYERELISHASVVFTGGQSLFEAKRSMHHNISAMPSSIDVSHFRQAWSLDQSDPVDQKTIPHPRIGFYGVIDERLDIALLGQIAANAPDLHWIMIGPVVKIPHDSLPHHSNIHYLGQKSYEELPQYLAHWDAAMLPFARNDSTRFISPTKTPEYLAARLPVISTSIRDVIRPYGEQGLVEIADTAKDYIAAARRILSRGPDQTVDWLARVDKILSQTSWDKTWKAMDNAVNAVVHRKQEKRPQQFKVPAYALPKSINIEKSAHP